MCFVIEIFIITAIKVGIMDFIDTQLENSYQEFLKTVTKNVRKKRITEKRTVEDIAFDALGHNSTSFYNSAENLKNGKHFNLKHLFLIAKYFDSNIQEFFNDGDSTDAFIR